MNKTKTIFKDIIDAKPISDIPARLALEAKDQWQTIRDAQLIERLTEFRVEVEAEAGIAVANIPTNLGLALADVTEGLGIKDPNDLLRVLGEDTYLAIYVDQIPYRPVPGHQPVHELKTYPVLAASASPIPPHHSIKLLVAKLRDAWQGRWNTSKTWKKWLKTKQKPC